MIVLLAFVVEAGNNIWTSNGPYGGFLTGFTFHPQNPNLILAGSQTDVYRSKNGGLTWERLPVQDFCGNMVVKIHPRSPELLIAGGDSIYSSTDQGNNWQLLADFPFFGGGMFATNCVEDLEFHPENPQVIYVTANGSGVFKSTDGGISWKKKNSGLDLTRLRVTSISALEMDPADPNNLYVLLANGKVFQTTNGGDSWKSVSQGLNFRSFTSSLAMDPKDSKVLYAGGSGIFKTTNGGSQWAQIYDGRVWGIAIDPNHSQIGYAVGEKALKSTDEGLTWNEMPLDATPLQSVAVHPKRSNTMLVGGFYQGVFRSMNAGASWQLLTKKLDGLRSNSVATHPRRPSQIFATGGGVVTGDGIETRKLYESGDGGNHWQEVAGLRDFDFISDVAVHPKNPDLVVVVGDKGFVEFAAISADGGVSWQSTELPFSSVLDLALDSETESVLYVAGFGGVAKSSNGGNTWTASTSGLTDSFIFTIAVSPSNPSILFAGGSSGKVYKSTNGGRNWKDSSNGFQASCCVNVIAIDPKDSNLLYAGSFGAGLYKSTNGGKNWTHKGGSFTDLAFDPSDSRRIYASSVEGLFVSTDAAETFSIFDSRGLSTSAILALFVDSLQAGRFLIGTDRGVFAYERRQVAGAPVIEQVNPSAAKVGDTITIVGKNFGATQGNSTVLFGSVSTGAAQSWTDARIQVKAPNGANTGPVRVTVAAKKSNSFEFIVLPTSGNLTPTVGPSSGGTRITILAPSSISGTQFNVLFGSTLAREIRFTSPNVILCTTPPGSGTVDVSVASAVVVSKVGTFTYQ